MLEMEKTNNQTKIHIFSLCALLNKKIRNCSSSRKKLLVSLHLFLSFTLNATGSQHQYNFSKLLLETFCIFFLEPEQIYYVNSLFLAVLRRIQQ